jgi:hypothetical protein
MAVCGQFDDHQRMVFFTAVRGQDPIAQTSALSGSDTCPTLQIRKIKSS